MEIGKRSRNRPVGVLKCAWDLFESSMVRPADGETTVMKEEVYAHRSLETGSTAHFAGPQGETPASVRRQSGERGRHGPKPLLGVSRDGLGEAW